MSVDFRNNKTLLKLLQRKIKTETNIQNKKREEKEGTKPKVHKGKKKEMLK